MKYMGSKRVMLQNGLGELVRVQIKGKKRIVDLFSGSASVSWFAAQSFAKPVFSVDLQEYAAVLARSVVERTSTIDATQLGFEWLEPVLDKRSRSRTWKEAEALDRRRPNAGAWANQARRLCSQIRGTGPVWRAYGGYYFSPSQAVTFDLLRRGLPLRGTACWVCGAALLIAASQCVAAPGHTAQPFASTRSAGPYLREAWLRDPLIYVRRALADLSKRHARVKGVAKVGDAVTIAQQLTESDLVFVDPPYSGVHYSRFYHVLETIARGRCNAVDGTGRYPPPAERPVSSFSRKTESTRALKTLFARLANVGCTAIVTFPAAQCSNGLSGYSVEKAANENFLVEKKTVATKFSTLGGNNLGRDARKKSREMILLLRPRP